MKNLLLLVMLLSFSFLNAQNNFEEGYYIDNSGNKINCLIKNLDWKNSPESIVVKNNNGEEKLINILDFKEFSVEGIKYIKSKVLIDRSFELSNKLSDHFEPDFIEETVFLKCLSLGKANLYLYRDTNLFKLFTDDTSGTKEQLMFKSYTISGTVRQNNTYKSQILFLNDCENISSLDLQKLNYSEKELTKLFNAYNTCYNENFSNELKVVRKGTFNLYPRIGASFFNGKLEASNNLVATSSTKYDSKISYRLGLELEYILPFNNNKWAVSVEPIYTTYSSDDTSDNLIKFDVVYKGLSSAVGIKHYMFLPNEKYKLFLNAGMNIPLLTSSDSKVGRVESKSSTNLYFGGGLNINKKISVEARFDANKKITQVNGIAAGINSLSLIFAYNIL